MTEPSACWAYAIDRHKHIGEIAGLASSEECSARCKELDLREGQTAHPSAVWTIAIERSPKAWTSAASVPLSTCTVPAGICEQTSTVFCTQLEDCRLPRAMAFAATASRLCITYHCLTGIPCRSTLRSTKKANSYQISRIRKQQHTQLSEQLCCSYDASQS